MWSSHWSDRIHGPWYANWLPRACARCSSNVRGHLMRQSRYHRLAIRTARAIVMLAVGILLGGVGRNEAVAKPLSGKTRAVTNSGGSMAPRPTVVLASAGMVADSISPSPGVMRRAQAVALVIGIEKYRRSLPDAVGSAQDARAFASVVEQSFGLPRSNICFAPTGT